jgi:hypothetical protein
MRLAVCMSRALPFGFTFQAHGRFMSCFERRAAAFACSDGRQAWGSCFCVHRMTGRIVVHYHTYRRTRSRACYAVGQSQLHSSPTLRISYVILTIRDEKQQHVNIQREVRLQGWACCKVSFGAKPKRQRPLMGRAPPRWHLTWRCAATNLPLRQARIASRSRGRESSVTNPS